MLGRAQRPSHARGLHITLPSAMPLVAHPTRQGRRQKGGRTSPFRPPRNASVLPEGMMPLVLSASMMQQMSFVHPAFGIGLAFYMLLIALIRRHDDMLSSPLGQHILDYEPPRGFVISTFTMFDGFVDPYDHMLHYNQVMILNAGNDLLLCKVFPASLWGPTLAWFHKLPRNSINSFNELWAAFVS